MLYYLTYSLLDIVFASSVWLLCKSTNGIYKITKQLTNKNCDNFYLKNDEYELMVIDDDLSIISKKEFNYNYKMDLILKYIQKKENIILKKK